MNRISVDVGGCSVTVQEAAAEESMGGTGGRVWSCSLLLLEFLAESGLARGRHVVELGCGTGVVGIACAEVPALGAASVVLSDRDDDSLDLARANVAEAMARRRTRTRRENVATTPSRGSSRASTTADPPAPPLVPIHVCKFDWADPAACLVEQLRASDVVPHEPHEPHQPHQSQRRRGGACDSAPGSSGGGGGGREDEVEEEEKEEEKEKEEEGVHNGYTTGKLSEQRQQEEEKEATEDKLERREVLVLGSDLCYTTGEVDVLCKAVAGLLRHPKWGGGSAEFFAVCGVRDATLLPCLLTAVHRVGLEVAEGEPVHVTASPPPPPGVGAAAAGGTQGVHYGQTVTVASVAARHPWDGDAVLGPSGHGYVRFTLRVASPHV